MHLETLVDKACEIAGSQRKLALLLGVSHSNVSEWRAGSRSCPDAKIVAMARMVPGDTRAIVASVYLARLGKLALISLAGVVVTGTAWLTGGSTAHAAEPSRDNV